MKLRSTYSQILAISIPIMLGSAAQNVVVLTDNIFLFHKSALEFASIGIIGVFYLIIAAMGYAFSRGGQIIIARRFGEFNQDGIGKSAVSLFYLELLFAVLVFLFIQFFSDSFFAYFISNEDILSKCLDYIYPRSYGVFFSFTGLAMIGLYTGVARTSFIIWDTLLLVVVNLILNYCLIFGKYGLPEMGITGAAWASTIAEIAAFIVFVIYMIYQRAFSEFKILKNLKPDFVDIWSTFKLSIPIVIQSVVGIGSWFVFFAMIENLGLRELEVSNLVRNVYLILSIPCWGFSAGINTMVSNFIGQGQYEDVFNIIKKTSLLSVSLSMLISLPIIFFPEYSLYPLFGSSDTSLFDDSQHLFLVLTAIIFIFSLGGVIINGLIGTGATMIGMYIQTGLVVFYLIGAHLVINVYKLSLEWAWSIEFFYWLAITICSLLYLRFGKWKGYRV